MVKVDCPNCKGNVVKSYDNEVKLRAKIIKWNKDGMFAICKSCNSDIPIAVDVLKSINSTFVYEVDDILCRD